METCNFFKKNDISSNNGGQASLQLLMFCLVLSGISAPLYLIPSMEELVIHDQIEINETKEGKSVNNGEIVLDDFGKENPISVKLPGKPLKYVEIGASNIDISSAQLENNTLTATSTSLSPFGVSETVIYSIAPDAGGTSIASGLSTNWNGCVNPSTFVRTVLTNSSNPTCDSVRQGTSATAPMADFFFNYNYTVDTNIQGNWYYGYLRFGGSSRTFTFRLIYVFPNGTIITLPGSGNITSSIDQNANVSLAGISGTIPAGAKLGLRINKSSTTTFMRFYVGNLSNANNDGPSGYFSITDSVVANYYTLSGYVFNQSSGLPLNGATVETNTSVRTTTNSSGYYSLELRNGTYSITASLANYNSNSTTGTINGSNVNNVNVALISMPAYLVSGFVTDKYNYGPISGVTIITDTDLNTITDADGLYTYYATNGTHIVSASKSGYSTENYTITVNGDVVFQDIKLSAISKIFVATNRYVILDDPIDDTKIAQTEANFSLPVGTGWNLANNQWKDNQTTIKAYALLLDDYGVPIHSIPISFTIRNWNDSFNQTFSNVTTDSNGIAQISYDMGDSDYYGNWYVYANTSEKSDSTGFIYNWWGCNSGGCQNHGSNSPGAATTSRQNSPYTLGRETIISNGVHSTAQNDANCVGCHRSYGGTGGGTQFTGQPTKTSDVHTTNTCATCHDSYTTHGTDQPIKSCSDCHNRTDLSKKTTMSGSPLRSNYSGGAAATGHNYNSTIPCIICHGPMHNITKPDESIRFTSNNNTEVSHCMTCHTSYRVHNNSINCTLCHSDDIHVVQVFSKNATYIPLNIASPNPERGNCTLCHQNSTFFSILKNNSRAGTQTSITPPQIPNPNHHSDAYDNGTRYGSFWDMGSQDSACQYCHGKTEHEIVALGRISLIRGSSQINSTFTGGTTSWCLSCHYPGSANYSDMVATFGGNGLSIPPSIIQGSNYYVRGRNHSYNNYNDSLCYTCHNDTGAVFTTISPFMHNVSIGVGGGPNCITCHDIGRLAAGKLVNFSAMNTPDSIHKDLNSQVSNISSSENKKCWACHGNGSEPAIGHPSNYKTPRRCVDCHLPLSMGGGNHNQIPDLACRCHDGIPKYLRSHLWNGDSIQTPAVTSCNMCHNKSGMLIPGFDPDNGTGSVYGGENGGNSSPSHYGKKRTDLHIADSTNCSYCHQNISTEFKSVMSRPTYSSSISNHSTGTNSPDCYNCHGSGWIHNATLNRPSFSVPNSIYCITCHNTKERHNGSSGLNCTQCHINDSSSDTIHPIKYLQTNRSFQTSNTSAVNCTNCHQNSSFWTGSPFAPIIPGTLKHSSNITNGSIWNSTTPFWETQDGSCYYCHNNTKHNSTAMGRISSLMTDTNNTRNGSTGTTTWCVDCHYNAPVNTNYKGDLWPLAPPLITVNNTDNLYWINHSVYLGGGYKDSICQPCHTLNGPYTSTSLNYSHSLNEGIGCTGCHAQPPSGTTRYNMTGAHDLHSTAGYGNIPETSCDYCHATEGRNESGHPNSNDNANVTTNASASIAVYTRNTSSGNDDTCSGVSCHSIGLSISAQLGTAIWNSSTSGACNQCHSTASSGLPPTGNHSKHYTTRNYSCATCHGANADTGNQTGHKTNGTIDVNFTNVSLGGNINGSKACSVYCHSPNSNDIKPKPIWNTSNVSCGDCHSLPPVTTRNNFPHPAETDCDGCHGAGASTGTHLGHIDGAVVGGGGPDCISCHDIGGAGAPLNKRINAQYVKLGIHRDLNGNASNVTVVDPINKACWACHGEGNEPGGHPERYQNPRECSNNDCHALSQLFRAPMVYSHFKDAELNDNPTEVLNFNVSTRSLCEDCHYNSLVLSNETKSNSSVSHYASTDKLIESVNCIYCHLDKDNAKDWGNAIEINKNRTSMIQINRENNKITAMTGEIIDLGTGYRIKVTGVSLDRGSAAIEIYKIDTLVHSGLVKIGEYILKEILVIDNSSVRTPTIVLNITNMFVSVNGSFIQFNGSRIKRVHPENRTTSCISCHYKGSAEKHKYVVIDQKDEDVYYTEIIFNSSDKELYDQEKSHKLLVTLTPLDKYLDIQNPLRTTLKQGTPWDIGKDYRLTLREVSTDSKTALFDLEIGGRTYTDIVRKGEKLKYNLSINYLGNTYTEVAIFNATVKEIIQASPNIVILENVKALSPEIMSVKDNTTLYGYNTSWFWVDDTFITGRIPQNLHVPLLFDGKVGGPDCVSCHGQKDLGKHKMMNVKTSSRIASENKACWICHGDGNEPKGHPVTYNRPRACKSCHADRIEPYYNATYIGDENHKNLADCRICHVVDTHKIVRFDVMPGIKELSLSKDEIYTGEKITLKARALAGFNMRLKAVEYYIDSPENKLAMVPADGSFDGQIEDVTAQVNTVELKAGEHMIYVGAMERNDKWGPQSSISFNIKEKEINIPGEEKEENKSDGILYGTSGAILSIIMGYSIRKYLMKK